jgi:hypothetical protein
MQGLFILFIIVCILALIIFVPFAVIWALGILGLPPVYDFWHWLAVLCLIGVAKCEVIWIQSKS